MEKECLDILLRGKQTVILCPARTLQGLRLEQRPRRALDSGQLLLLSPFDEDIRRTTAAQAVERNDLVAAVAEAVLVPHAAPGGKTWGTVTKALDREQSIYTLDDTENGSLFDAGAVPLPLPLQRPNLDPG